MKKFFLLLFLMSFGLCAYTQLISYVSIWYYLYL